MTHAGFWVDGAVRKPEARHCDSEDTVIARWKRKGDREQTLGVSNEFDICHRYFPNWDKVYWLDTTPRESLTPEELFSVVKVLWPELEYVDLATDGGWCVANNQTNNETPVQWNGLERYPPPSEPQWVVVTRENVGQYLFRECRFKVIPDKADTYWKTGRVVGWCIRENCCLVDSDFNDEEPVMVWAIVEVQS